MTIRYVKSTEVVERTVRNTLVLVPMKTGPARLDALYTLNETSGFIWRQITPGITEDELVAIITRTYEIDGETARRDVARILRELCSIGALTSAGED